MAKGRVTILEELAAKAAPQTEVAAIAQTVEAMAAEAAAQRFIRAKGVTDSTSTVTVLVDPPMYVDNLVVGPPKVSGRAITITSEETEDAQGRCTRVVFTFWETVAQPAVKTTTAISLSLAVGSAIGKTDPVVKLAGAGIGYRFTVAGKNTK